MLAVQRTHLQRHDRDWLPASVRRTGRAVSGVVWGGAGLAFVGAVILTPAVFLFWKALAVGGASVAVLGERAGRYAFRRKLAKLTRGDVPLAEVRSRQEGELVCVRGKIEAETTLRGVLHGTEGVYRRMVFDWRGVWVHEAAVDFSLVDDRGDRILVQCANARWLVPDRERMEYPIDAFRREDGLGLPREIRERLLQTLDTKVEATERVLEVGTAVQIVGYKTASPDVTGDVGDYRSSPQRATLTSGDDIPLVITMLRDS
ncbi:MAG: hypothetical protein WKG01_34630 [Kofleriaceae bacterium]